MALVSEISQIDTDLVLINTTKKVSVTFKNEDDIAVNPAVLSLQVTNLNGSELLTDIYFPILDRDPDPPRIINSSTGIFEFPFGQDNSLSDTSKINKTTMVCDYLFTWRASQTESIQATKTINPGTGANSLLDWTAVQSDSPGNLISIEYINPAIPNQTLSIVRDGAKIQVNLATNSSSVITTTANDIIAELQNVLEALEIITVALTSGSNGSQVVDSVSSTFLSGGIDATEETSTCTNVRVISERMCSLIGKFRLLIDKAMKLINCDPDDLCYLGHTDGQIMQYLDSGLQIINSYQPYGVFTFTNFPYSAYDFILLESSLISGMMSQSMFAIDTDIPSWNDQGNAFVITHYPQLAQYLNWLSARLDKLIPLFKLHFVRSGSLHVEAGPNYRLAQLINAAPSGSLFRNFYSKVV